MQECVLLHQGAAEGAREGVRSQQSSSPKRSAGASRLPQTSRSARSPSGSRNCRVKEKKVVSKSKTPHLHSTWTAYLPRLPVYLCRRFVPYLNSPEGPFPRCRPIFNVNQKEEWEAENIGDGVALLFLPPPHSQPLPLCRWDLPGLNSFGGGSEWTVGERQLASTPSGLHLSPLA